MDKDDVLGLDVAVEYLVAVHESDGVEQVADDEGGGFLGEGLSAGDDVEELSVAAQLHDDVEVLVVAEVAVDLDDVGVVEEALDLQLPHELHQEVLPHDPLLLDHLQPHDQPRTALPRQVHAPELPLAQPPDHLEALLRQPFPPLLELRRRLRLAPQERGERALGLVGHEAFGVGGGGGFLEQAGLAAGAPGAEELRGLVGGLGAAIALGEDLGMRGLLHHVPAVALLAGLLGRRQVLRRPQVLHLLQLLLGLVPLEGSVPEAQVAQLHLEVAVAVFGGARVGVEDEAAADWHALVALPPETAPRHQVAIHKK